MNRPMIVRAQGHILLCLAFLLMLPTAVALIYGERVSHFLITIALSGALGLGMSAVRPRNKQIFAREGFVIVALGWILMSLFGALPFWLSGEIASYVDAFFETVSGFTTTGSSILGDIESLSRGCLFWRSFTHWVGGMGVLVFIMAVLPMSGDNSMHIMRAEVPGPTVGKLVPRARQTAKILYMIYVALTVLQAILLLLGGMDLYDAVVHSFATAGTGGFSVYSQSIGHFDSQYIETVITVFMALFGINFNIYFLLLLGRWRDALKSEELHWYVGIIVAAALAIALGISNMYGGFFTGLRHAFFNVCSIITTTGFCTVDYVQWPAWCQWILVLLMFCGASAGSTGGGLKVSRVLILVKDLSCQIRSMVRPRSVSRVQLEGKRVDAQGLKTVSVFFSAYVLIVMLGTLLVSLEGHDMPTSFSAALTCISNVGPGLSQIGPTGNFAIFSAPVKLFLSGLMLFGRLEIFPMLIFLAPSTWRR